MSQLPFEIMRWESTQLPSIQVLENLLIQENLSPTTQTLCANSQTPEMKFEKVAIKVLVSGKLQFAFPGYGVIELHPGDILEINPDTLHDIYVLSSQEAILLEAFKEA